MMKNLLIIDNYVKGRPLDHLKCALEAHGITAEVIRYNAPDLQTKAKDSDALVLGGTENRFSSADLGEYMTEMALIRSCERPIFGICGGHQLIGIAYGSEVVPLGYEVKKHRNVQIVQPDPLFRSLPTTIRVLESHTEIVNKLPQNLIWPHTPKTELRL